MGAFSLIVVINLLNRLMNVNSTARAGELELDELKRLLTNQGLDTAGSKEDLVRRLNESRNRRTVTTGGQMEEVTDIKDAQFGQDNGDMTGKFNEQFFLRLL